MHIRVHSAALNPVDRKVLEHGVGFTPAVPTEDAPFYIDFDAAGTVVELGSDVSKDDNDDKGFHVGDAVYAMLSFTSFGAVGEFVDVDAQLVTPKPTNLDFDQAASVPLAALTSYQALATVVKVQSGERMLILGGSGGTGVFAVQIAKALGADRVVDYTKYKWVDVLYDCGMEPEAWNGDAQRVLKRGGSGRFATILTLTEPVASPIGAHCTQMLVQPSGQDLRVTTSWIENRQVKPVIDSVHPLECPAAAMDRVKSSRARGKVVVHVADPSVGVKA